MSNRGSKFQAFKMTTIHFVLRFVNTSVEMVEVNMQAFFTTSFLARLLLEVPTVSVSDFASSEHSILSNQELF